MIIRQTHNGKTVPVRLCLGNESGYYLDICLYIEVTDSDDLCRNGDVLSSPALSFTLRDLTASVDAVRREKLHKEQPDEDLEASKDGSTT